jgi:protein-disulfide isomerase
MSENNGKRDNFLAVSILIASFVIGGSVLYAVGGRDDSGSLAVATETLGGSMPQVDVSIDDDVILGDRNAPVTLIEFGDFQCPYCKQLFDQTEGRLRDEYIQTGKVRMVYRDFPLDQIHPYARAAAEAAECARDQGSYWLYHDELYARQASIPTLDFVVLAGELGLDAQAFEACADSGKYKDEVEKDYQDGIAAGVRGTPAVFINGKLFSGALPYETFKAAIDAELNS